MKGSTRSWSLSLPWEIFHYWAVTVALLGCLLFSIVSALDLCANTCSEMKSYRLFGFHFSTLGIVLFSSAILIHWISRNYPFMRTVLAVMIASAIGAELFFIWIQHHIGIWCPICLSIATFVAITAFLLTLNQIAQQKGQTMQIFKNFSTMFSISILGLLAAIIGISKPDYNLMAMNEMQQKIEFGNPASPIKIYFVTDWFCVVCRQVEPTVYKLAPKIMKQATFYFVDKPVHPETTNYTPYNLAFMVSEKPKYFEIRKALGKLSMTNRAPNDEAIQHAVASTGAKLQELNYGDIKAGINFFDETVKRYKVWGTPSIVVVNTKNNKYQVLSGEDDFTEAKIYNAMKTVQSP